MKKIIAIIGLAVIMLTAFSACKKSKKDLENYTCEQLEDAMVAAQEKYINSPTPSNCRAYKNSLQDLKTKKCYDYYDESTINIMIASLIC